MTQGRLRNLEVVAIALVCVVVFFHQESLAPLPRMLFEDRYGAVPSIMWEAWRRFEETGFHRELLVGALPLVTANFLHADVSHIGGNLLFLWVFGNVVSQTVGRWLFLVTYLFAGVVAVLIHVHSNPGSDAPMVGASGAIAGLEGAYFALVFRWEVQPANVWPVSGPVHPSALALLAIVNFVLDTGSFVGHAQDHTAYGAHAGGFLGGALVAMVIATFATPTWRGRHA